MKTAIKKETKSGNKDFPIQFGSVVECDCGARIKLDPRKGIVLERQNIKNKEEDSEQSRTGK